MILDPFYFISKFSAIPEEKWWKGDFFNPRDKTCRCAFGHCGVEQYEGISQNEEAKALIDILEYNSKYLGTEAVTCVNDHADEFKHLGKTPKQRIINRLKEIKYELDSERASEQD